jgi:hypothetical protein
MLDSSSSRYSDTHQEPSIMDQYMPKRAVPTRFTRMGMPSGEVSMKNGRYRVALLVGTPADLARKLREKLGRQRGVLAKHHWEAGRVESNDRPIPKDVDIVIIFTDFLSHTGYYKVVQKAKEAGVRVIRTVTKSAKMYAALNNYMRTAEAIPEHILSTTVFGDDLAEDPADREVEIPKYIRSAPPPVVEVPVLGEVTAKAPLKAMDATPTVQIVVQQALSPIELPKRTPGIPSSQLAALAAALHQMCSEERVSILCTPTELNFSKAS